jgi:hypothetical protein
MSLGKTEQDLKRDLEGIALDLKWSMVELKGIAHRLEESGNQAQAQALLRMADVFERGESRLKLYADAVRGGRIVWVGASEPVSGADLSS